MGFFTKSTSKQTAKLKSLIKIAVARLAVVRRPRVGRRSIARSDVAQLLAIGDLDRALVRVCRARPRRNSYTASSSCFPSRYRIACVAAQAEQVIEEDHMLEVLDIIELYCKILIEQAAQLDKPKFSTAPSIFLFLTSSPLILSVRREIVIGFFDLYPGSAARRSRRRRRGSCSRRRAAASCRSCWTRAPSLRTSSAGTSPGQPRKAPQASSILR